MEHLNVLIVHVALYSEKRHSYLWSFFAAQKADEVNQVKKSSKLLFKLDKLLIFAEISIYMVY